MTRREIIKSLKRTLSSYEKKGYSFDLDLSSMSTQKLVSLRKYKGDDLIRVIAQRHPESNVAKIQAIKTEEKSRERVIKDIERKLSKYKQEGWDIEIKREDLEKMSLIELRNLSKSGKMGIAGKYGLFYSFKSGSKIDKTTTITAKEAVEMLKLRKAAEMQRIMRGAKTPIGMPSFTGKAGKEKYLEYLQKAASREYWENIDKNAALNFVKAMRTLAKVTPDTNFLMKPLLDYIEAHASEAEIIRIIKTFEQNAAGIDAFRYIYDEAADIETKISTLYAAFGLTDLYNKRLEQLAKLERNNMKVSRVKIHNGRVKK